MALAHSVDKHWDKSIGKSGQAVKNSPPVFLSKNYPCHSCLWFSSYLVFKYLNIRVKIQLSTECRQPYLLLLLFNTPLKEQTRKKAMRAVAGGRCG
jgi:hypothetical protein